MESRKHTHTDSDEESLKKSEFFLEIEKNPGPKFDCSGLHLTPSDMAQLVDILKKKETIESIDLSYNALDTKSMPHIRKILFTFSALKDINLENNQIGDTGIDSLLNGDPNTENVDNLESINQRLREILPNLEINFDTNGINDRGLLQIKDFLSPNSLLRLLGGNIVYISPDLYEECRKSAVLALQNNSKQSNNKSSFTYNPTTIKPAEEYKSQTPPKSPTGRAY